MLRSLASTEAKAPRTDLFAVSNKRHGKLGSHTTLFLKFFMADSASR